MFGILNWISGFYEWIHQKIDESSQSLTSHIHMSTPKPRITLKTTPTRARIPYRAPLTPPPLAHTSIPLLTL